MDNKTTLGKIIMSVVVGIITALVLILVGKVLVTVDQETVATIGDFLRDYAGLFGLLAGIVYFFTGRTARDVL